MNCNEKLRDGLFEIGSLSVCPFCNKQIGCDHLLIANAYALFTWLWLFTILHLPSSKTIHFLLTLNSPAWPVHSQIFLFDIKHGILFLLHQSKGVNDTPWVSTDFRFVALHLESGFLARRHAWKSSRHSRSVESLINTG